VENAPKGKHNIQPRTFNYGASPMRSTVQLKAKKPSLAKKNIFQSIMMENE